jgi:hypothetical protein
MDKINKEVKIIGAISFFTLIVLIGSVFFFSNQDKGDSSVPPDQIVSENGLHWHPRLEIYINGEKQKIPPNVGLGAVHAPIHTHDEDAKDGVIHMEMAGIVTRDETRLGNFFQTWGKKFSSTQIFDKKNGEGGKIKMIINGKENNEFENYMMKDGDKIEIRYE